MGGPGSAGAPVTSRRRPRHVMLALLHESSLARHAVIQSRELHVLSCPCCGFVLQTECLHLLAHNEHAVVVAAGIDIIPPQLV